mgnify:CR=1 FL=1
MRLERQESQGRIRMRIFDTHAHYDDEAFDVDRDELLNKLLSTDIDTIVNVGEIVRASCREKV